MRFRRAQSAALAAAAICVGCSGPMTWRGDPDASQDAPLDTSSDSLGPADSGASDATAPSDDAAAPWACATIDSWQTTEAFSDVEHRSHPLPSFASGPYYYVHTMSASAGDRVLYSARQNADGSLASWQVASSDHGGGPHGYVAVDVAGQPFHFRNGHIARYDLREDGTMGGDVVLVEESVETAFDGERYVWDTAVYAPFPSGEAFVFHLGGFSIAPYAYRPRVRRNTVPLGGRFADAGRDHPDDHPGKTAFWVPAGSDVGFLFTGTRDDSRLWRARVSIDGSLDEWESMPDLPEGSGNQRGDLFVARDTLFVVRGARVFRTALGAEGLAPWQEVASLPEEQVDVTWGDGHLEGAAYGLIGDFVYLTGPHVVYWAALRPDAACAR